MTRNIMILLICVFICITLLKTWSDEEKDNEEKDIEKYLITREVVPGFGGKIYLYYDYNENKLKGSTLISFFNEHNYSDGVKDAKFGATMIGVGWTLYRLGFLIMFTPLITTDYNSPGLNLPKAFIIIGSGAICSFIGVLGFVQPGKNKIDKAVRVYNRKVKNRELSIKPSISPDGLALLLNYRF